MISEERCVVCGSVIPEGRQVCPDCEKGNQPAGRDDNADLGVDCAGSAVCGVGD